MISYKVRFTSLRGAKQRGNPDAFIQKAFFNWLDCLPPRFTCGRNDSIFSQFKIVAEQVSL